MQNSIPGGFPNPHEPHLYAYTKYDKRRILSLSRIQATLNLRVLPCVWRGDDVTIVSAVKNYAYWCSQMEKPSEEPLGVILG